MALERIELQFTVYKTVVLPLNYKAFYDATWNRTKILRGTVGNNKTIIL